MPGLVVLKLTVTHISMTWGRDIKLLRKFDLVTFKIVLRKSQEITENGCRNPNKVNPGLARI